jgi:DNA repair exonuclease SbcCD ATPase subunit
MYDAAQSSEPLLGHHRRTTRSSFTLAQLLVACGAACACTLLATVTVANSVGNTQLARRADDDADAAALGGLFKKAKKFVKRVKNDVTDAVDDVQDSVEAQLVKTKAKLEDVKADLKECKAQLNSNDDAADAALGGLKKKLKKAKKAVTDAVTDAVDDAKDVKETLEQTVAALKECKAKLDAKSADDAATLGGLKKAFKNAKKASSKVVSTAKDAAVDAKDVVTDAASAVKAKLEQAANDLDECTAQLDAQNGDGDDDDDN